MSTAGPEFRYFSDESALYKALECELRATLESLMSNAERVVAVLPGGRTPTRYLPGVFAAELPWQRLMVMPTDERWVPLDDPHSNEALLGSIVPPACERFGLYTGDAAPEAALERIEQKLVATLGSHPPELVVVGMGADGHVASVFPGVPVQLSAGGLVCAARPAGLTPRISLSLSLLGRAPRIFLVAADADKAAQLENVMAGQAENLPVGELVACAGSRLTVFTCRLE